MPYKNPEDKKRHNREYRARNPQKHRARSDAWKKQNPVRALLHDIKRRAAKKGLEFNLVPSDIDIPDKCPILGIPIIQGASRSDNSPSVDRIDPSKGYIPGNVHVISDRANRIKNNATIEELELIANYLRMLENHDRS